MNRHFATALTFATTTAAVVCAAAMASGSAYAETPLAGGSTPFTSSRTRAEVQADLTSQRALVTAAGSEWAMQSNHVPQLASGYSSAQAKADYRAARQEVMAFTAEDSGSSYLARQRTRMSNGITVAGQAR